MPLTRADLDAALADVQARSVKAYLRRQALEQARISIAQQIFTTEQELVKLDGEEAAIIALTAKATNGQ